MIHFPNPKDRKRKFYQAEPSSDPCKTLDLEEMEQNPHTKQIRDLPHQTTYQVHWGHSIPGTAENAGGALGRFSLRQGALYPVPKQAD